MILRKWSNSEIGVRIARLCDGIKFVDLVNKYYDSSVPSPMSVNIALIFMRQHSLEPHSLAHY